jgi:hypothetical protein
MKTNENIEKVYDLVEQFEFSELSEPDKLYILSFMTENEYNDMRAVLKGITKVFKNNAEPDFKTHQSPGKEKSKLLRFIHYPVQLYQVASCIVILFGLYFLFQNAIQHKEGKSLSSITDTSVIYKADTILARVYDTIRIGTTKVTYSKNEHNKMETKELTANSQINYDCNHELCPGEVERIKDLTLRNNITNDSILKDFLVTLN